MVLILYQFQNVHDIQKFILLNYIYIDHLRMKLKMNSNLIFVLLITSVLSSKVLDKPNSLYVDKQIFNQNNYVFFQGETVLIQYTSIYSEFNGFILERIPAIDEQLFEDFTKNPNYYYYSQSCELIESDFDFEQINQLKIPELHIQDYTINEVDRKIYFLTNFTQIIQFSYTVSDDSFIVINQNYSTLANLTIPYKSNFKMLYYQIYDILYVFTDQQVFAINTKGDNTISSLVAGYNQSSFEGEYVINNNHLLIIHPLNNISIYFIETKNHFRYVTTINQFTNLSISPVDAIYDKNRIWVLDIDYGIYQYDFNGVIVTQIEKYQIPYAKKLFFKKIANTFLITFEVNKETYVAEIFFNDNQMMLNRFYDQIKGILDIIVIDQLIIILGEDDLMVITHSIHQQLLKETFWQKKRYFDSSNFKKLNIINNLKKRPTSIMVGMSFDSISFVNISRTFTQIMCNLKDSGTIGKHSVYIQINATTCDALKGEYINGVSYCNIRQSFNFNVVKTRQKRQALAMSISFFIVGLLIVAFIFFCSLMYRRKRKEQINKLKEVLKKKMEEMERQGQKGQKVQQGGEQGIYVNHPIQQQK